MKSDNKHNNQQIPRLQPGDTVQIKPSGNLAIVQEVNSMGRVTVKVIGTNRLYALPHYECEKVETEDVTPTWEDVLPIHLEAYAHKRTKAAKDEILRMAQTADKWNRAVSKLQALQEEGNLTNEQKEVIMKIFRP